MKKVLALMAVGALASTALAGFTLTGLSGNSAGPPGSPLNTVITYVYSGPEFDIGNLVFEGDLTKVHPATYASEARFKITNPAGQVGFVPALTNVASYTGTIHIGPTTITGAGAVFTGTTIGTWTFEMFESYDDGGPSAIDQTWSNLTIQVQDYVPVPPPSGVIDLGTLTGPLTVTAQLAARQIIWFKFTIGLDAANPGTFLDIDTEGSTLAPSNDTELGLFKATGQFRATDDDDGSNLLSQLTFGDVGPRPPVGNGQPYNGRDGRLSAGTYYLAVGGYNSTFSDGFTATSTSTNTGTVVVNFNTNIPEPATLVLLALGALLRRRR